MSWLSDDELDAGQLADKMHYALKHHTYRIMLHKQGQHYKETRDIGRATAMDTGHKARMSINTTSFQRLRKIPITLPKVGE